MLCLYCTYQWITIAFFLQHSTTSEAHTRETERGGCDSGTDRQKAERLWQGDRQTERQRGVGNMASREEQVPLLGRGKVLSPSVRFSETSTTPPPPPPPAPSHAPAALFQAPEASPILQKVIGRKDLSHEHPSPPLVSHGLGSDYMIREWTYIDIKCWMLRQDKRRYCIPYL